MTIIYVESDGNYSVQVFQRGNEYVVRKGATSGQGEILWGFGLDKVFESKDQAVKYAATLLG